TAISAVEDEICARAIELAVATEAGGRLAALARTGETVFHVQAEVVRGADRRQTILEWAVICCAALFRRDTAIVRTARPSLRAAFSGDRAEFARIRATELFAVAGAVAAGVVAAFRVRDADAGGVAAVRAAVLRSRGLRNLTNTLPADQGLLSRAAWRLWSWARPSCGLGPGCSGGRYDSATKTKQPLEHVPAVLAGRQ